MNVISLIMNIDQLIPELSTAEETHIKSMITIIII